MTVLGLLLVLAAPVGKPAILDVTERDAGDRWLACDGLLARGDVPNVLRLSPEGDLWIGTRRGRLLHRSGAGWRREVEMPAVQITDIGFDAGGLWLGTSDGVVRLTFAEGEWRPQWDRTFYEGHPAFVSGVYMPGDDAERLFGYVDAVYVPARIANYAPYVCSRAHGLFSSAGRSIWHHYLPHYWGANSDWLDLRELLPHRRATSIAEDGDGNLWIGTEWDGLFCFRAAGRLHSLRGPEANRPDPDAFATFGAEEVRGEFRRVLRLSATSDGPETLAIFEQDDGARFLRLGTGGLWEELPLRDLPGYLEDAAIDLDGNILVAGERGLWSLGPDGVMARLLPGVKNVRRVVADETAACATYEAVYVRPAG